MIWQALKLCSGSDLQLFINELGVREERLDGWCSICVL